MSFDRQAAIDAGYSEEEINAFLQSKEKTKRAEPVTTGSEPPPPGAPIEAVGMSGTEMATTAALGVPAAAAAALPYVGVAGAGYGAYKAGQVANKFIKGMPPAAPTYGSAAAPIGGPAVPTAAAPAAPAKPVAPSMLQRGGDLARQMQQAAASKVMPAATGLLRGAVAPSMALFSGSTGPAVPSVGRMRGMEINPLTGQGWTPDQIAQYERNFQAYDAQLGAPQMPR